MNNSSLHIRNVYLVLLLLNTLAASFIWGVNTLFLLDAGLSNTQAFAANAFFTIGQVLFEIPTGIVADTMGRRTSYLLGTVTLAISTILYLFAWRIHGPFFLWAITSMLLGLGFTFFSGATEAWLVDALEFTGYKGSLDPIFAKGQIVGGIAMLIGSVTGGFVAQFTNLGVPYVMRASILIINGVVAYFFMKDVGFVPVKSTHIIKDIKNLFSSSISIGLKKPSVRWIMLSAPFISGVSFYVFYAAQPYLLKLYGDRHAYGIAGLAAAIVAASQIIGGFMTPYLKNFFRKRTTVLITSTITSIVILVLLGITQNFWLAILLLVVWGLTSSAAAPVRQSYLNGEIPSKERATILSFDSVMQSSGGIVIQPGLGKVVDMYSYSLSFIVSALISIVSVPFIFLAHKEDPISNKF